MVTTTAVSSFRPAGAGPEHKLRFVYLVPKDQPFNLTHYEGVKRNAAKYAEWNRGQFGGAAPDYEVVWLTGEMTSRDYVYNRDGYRAENKSEPEQTWIALYNASREVFRRLGDPRSDPTIRYVIYLDEIESWNATQGTGISWEGYTFASQEDILLSVHDFPRAYLGLAHEGGHMWGLPHQGPDSDCMQLGFYNATCDYSQVNRDQLMNDPKSSQFFRGHTGKLLGTQAPPTDAITGVLKPEATVELSAWNTDRKCVDVSGVSAADGAGIIQWACGGADNQRFKMVPVTGGFMLKAVHSGKCLEIANSDRTAGRQVTQRTCSGASNQILNWRKASLQFSHSGLCLAVTGSSQADGANIVQESCNDWSNQQFRIGASRDDLNAGAATPPPPPPPATTTPPTTAPPTTAPPTTVAPATTGKSIVAEHSGSCVDVYGASTADGATVVQWTCLGATNQKFEVVAATGGFMLRAVHSNKCIDGARFSLLSGGAVAQRACTGASNQLLNWSAASLVFKHSNACLTVSGGSTANGTKLVQNTCRTATNQQFRLA